MKTMWCVILTVFLSFSAGAAHKRFDTMVIFGDSLSDNGNLYKFMWYKFPISPPYYEGRFSNGLLWIEQLYSTYFPANYLDGFQNYAVGGAGAVLSYKENLPFTLTVELNNYFYWHTYGKKDTSLYTIWIGANNYLNGPTNIDAITSSVVDAIGDGVEKIISYGGNKFFIPNLPDLGRVPQAAEMRIQPLLTELVVLHNEKLAQRVKELKQQYPEVTIIYFDVFTFFNQALDHARDYGFTNAIDACYTGSYSGWLLKFHPDDETLFSFLQQQDPRFDRVHWQMIKNNTVLREAAESSYIASLLPSSIADPLNCDGYIFWDRVHPSTRTHYYIAQKARELMDDAGLVAFVDPLN